MNRSVRAVFLTLLHVGICLLSGQAMAAFNTPTLIMSVYNNTTTIGDQEFGFNTGFDLSTADWNGTWTYTVQTGLNLTWFADTNPSNDDAAWADLQMGLWGRTTSGQNNGDYFFATTNPNENPNLGVTTTYATSTSQVRNYYDALDTDNDNIAIVPNNQALGVGATNHYDRLFNTPNTNTPGFYSGINNNNPADGEVNLAGFGDSDPNNDILTLYLHGFRRSGPTAIADLDLNNATHTAMITLNSNGLLTITNTVITLTYRCGSSEGEDTSNDPDGDEVCTAAYNGGYGIGTAPDNCPSVGNGGQEDWNANLVGDACDDSDGDGTMDASDGCRSDANKISPLQCGCGNPDTDTDHDTVADCIDDDDDGDSMPDAWEALYPGLNPLVDDADDDLDHDDFTNYEEYASPTDPSNPSERPTRPSVSAFSVDPSPVRTSDAVTVTADVAPGSGAGPLSYSWRRQMGGVWESLPQETSNEISFTAPSTSQTLVFELTVTDQGSGLASYNAFVAVDNTPDRLEVVVAMPLVNVAPGRTSLVAPLINPEYLCQVRNLPADPIALSVANVSDSNGDPIHFEFQVARDAAFQNIVAIAGSADVPQNTAAGANSTSWSFFDEDLLEDSMYYWHARACDDSNACSDWMETTGRIYVNSENSAPPVPSLQAPADEAALSSLTPTFEFQVPAQAGVDAYDTNSYILKIAAGANGFANPVQQYSYSCATGLVCNFQLPLTDQDQLAEQTYYWRVEYSDDGGHDFHAAEQGVTATYRFSINLSDLPNAPSLLEPVGGALAGADPILVFYNNGDPDGQPLDFRIELSAYADFRESALVTHTIHQTQADQALPRAYEWRVDASLVENQHYFWRVAVTDGTSGWVFSETGAFVYSAVNDPPVWSSNVAVSPANEASITTLTPTLSVSGVTDPENGTVYYGFELFSADEPDNPILASRRQTSSQYIIGPGDGLENGTTYRWRVTAYDGPGVAAASLALGPFTFTTAADQSRPSAPRLNSPFGGGIAGTKPTLSAFRAYDLDDPLGRWPLTYTFKLSTCANLNCGEVDLGAVQDVPGSSTVSATPVSELIEGQTYYWIVWATDRDNHSSDWMPTASFTVNSNPAFSLTVDLALTVSPRWDAEESITYSIDDPDSRLNGMSLEIPPGALSQPINLQIGLASGAPWLPVDKEAAGNGDVIILGPEGTSFNKGYTVTLRIPLNLASDQLPEEIQVLTYDAEQRTWVQVPSTLGTDGAFAVIQLEHFSLYTLATEGVVPSDDGGGSSSGGGGGGLGGCFIGSLQ